MINAPTWIVCGLPQHVARRSVIPREARLVGTAPRLTTGGNRVRLTSSDSTPRLRATPPRLAKYERVYPEDQRSRGRGGGRRRHLIGAGGRDLEPSMGSEDFSFMLEQRPGAYARLGQGGAEGGCFLHNASYDFNDEVIPLGAGYLAALAEAAMPISR